MHKHTKPIALLLTLSLLISSLSLTVFARDSSFKDSLRFAGAKGIELLLTGLVGAVNYFVPDGENIMDRAEYKSEGFLSGTAKTPSDPLAAPCWKLGSAEASLVPDDWQSHTYYIGGFIDPGNRFTNRVEEIWDDMRVRVIAIDDGTGRGTAVFATVDCIGITNKDVRQIRAMLRENMPDTAFAGITVCATHCHSGIDTEGLWTQLFRKLPMNLARAFIGMGGLETGTDPHYMEFLYKTVSTAMQTAVERMTTGSLSYASKDIGDDYFSVKDRELWVPRMTELNRLVFTPDKANVRPTMIVNVAAHPDVAGYPSDQVNNGRGVSGDYIYYMGECINGAGYDFMFFNGAIAAVYMSRGKTNNGQPIERRVDQSRRYGETLGKMALSLTMTEQEIEDDEYLSDDAVEANERAIVEANGGEYFIWYKDWTPVCAADVPADLNLRFAEVTVPVTNGIIELAGKLNLASYDVLREGRQYFIVTEIGYMELGNMVRVALMPGEVCQDLVVGGGSLTAELSFTNRDFGERSIRELFGENTIAFGLANDAIGYVVPDNDFCLCGLFGHYDELVSLGKHTASTILRAYADLAAGL